MASVDPLVSKLVLSERAAELRGLLKRDPVQVLEAARARTTSERRGTDTLESVVPLYFEVSELRRGTEAPEGPVRHGYDASNRLVLIEKPDAKYPGKARHNVFEYDGEQTRTFLIDTNPRASALRRVGAVQRLDGGVHYHLTADLHSASAHLWSTDADGLVSVLQYWDLRWDQPTTFIPTYDENRRLLRILRDDKVIWEEAARQHKRGLSGEEARELAKKYLELVRARMPEVKEPILLFTVACEMNDPKSLPPEVGVVFERDAQAFAADPDSFEDGADALLQPTLQEDYEFPTRTTYPFIEIRVSDGLPFDWDVKAMRANAVALMVALNDLRDPSSPPFLLVDREGSGTTYLSKLDAEDRTRLKKYGIG